MKLNICWFRGDTVAAFEELRRFFQRSHAQLDEVSKIERSLLESKPTPDQETCDEYFADIQCNETEFRKIMPRILGYAFITMLYSETEFQFRRLCSELELRKKLSLSLDKHKGTLKGKCKREGFSKLVQSYFEKFSLPLMSEVELKVLAELVLIRNRIVHSGGMMVDDDLSKKLRKLAEKENGIRCEYEYDAGPLKAEHGAVVAGAVRLSVDVVYCFSKLDAILAMFRRLFDELGMVPETMVVEK